MQADVEISPTSDGIASCLSPPSYPPRTSVLWTLSALASAELSVRRANDKAHHLAWVVHRGTVEVSLERSRRREATAAGFRTRGVHGHSGGSTPSAVGRLVRMIQHATWLA